VFGGIAFTAEHPAHRFLRRIGVRAQQFGDAAQHERRLGRELAERAARARPVPVEASSVPAGASPALAEAAPVLAEAAPVLAKAAPA
jgi:hypothetical protein